MTSAKSTSNKIFHYDVPSIQGLTDPKQLSPEVLITIPKQISDEIARMALRTSIIDHIFNPLIIEDYAKRKPYTITVTYMEQKTITVVQEYAEGSAIMRIVRDELSALPETIIPQSIRIETPEGQAYEEEIE